MDFLNRLFGRSQPAAPPPARDLYPSAHQRPADADERALERYRYLVRTAPPETIEQAHAEAFAKLTPEQRAKVLQSLTAEAPASEQAAMAGARADPRTLARYATRAEMRQPGAVERTLGQAGGGMGMGMGGMMAGTILGSLVAGVVGSMVAQQFMASMGDVGADGGEMAGDEATAADEAAYEEADGGDLGDDLGGDFGGEF